MKLVMILNYVDVVAFDAKLHKYFAFSQNNFV